MPDFLLAVAFFICLVIGKNEAASPGDVIFHVPEVIIQQHHHDRKSNEVIQPDDDADHGRMWEERKRAKEEEEHRHQQSGVGFEVEEYFVEHEISAPEARAAARQLDIHMIHHNHHESGCAECTRAEIDYCSGQRVLNDHCCCERRDHEPFAHVPHTCYAGATACRPLVGDCAQYARLRECCCDHLVAEKWKHILSSAHAPSALSWMGAGALPVLLTLATILERLH